MDYKEANRAGGPDLNKFNKINSCVTKARDIVWDAVVRVYTQLLINSPS